MTAHLAHAASWVLLWQIAQRRSLGFSLQGLAWVHLVALGWLTLVALSVLVFVVPQFTGVRWRGEFLARAGIAIFTIGALSLAVAFWNEGLRWLWLGALVAVLGLASYLAAACATLAVVLGRRGLDAAIARAFVTVFAFLLLAALAGLTMAFDLGSGHAVPGHLAPAHANVALAGWLTLLVMGVSARTLGPITGHRSPRRWMHVAASGMVAAGVVAFALSAWLGLAAGMLGALLCAVGLIVYAVDALNLTLTATVRHRVPQAFAGLAICWLLVASALGLSVAAGRDRFAPAYVFVALVGWVGQMVLAHLHHIGIRLVATLARGDDDETPPERLLASSLSWLTFALFQVAVGAGCISLAVAYPSLLEVAAVSGGLGWMCMTANVVRAIVKAQPRAQTSSG